MLKIMLLVCAAATAPDRCTEATAIFHAPLGERLPTACGFEAQARTARMVMSLETGDYAKVICAR